MFRKNKQQTTRQTRELKTMPSRGKDEKRIDFNICPYSPYGKFGVWFKAIFRF